jgi:hypothetical protein
MLAYATPAPRSVGICDALPCRGASCQPKTWLTLSLKEPAPAHRWRWWAPASVAGMALVLASRLLGSSPFRSAVAARQCAR